MNRFHDVSPLHLFRCRCLVSEVYRVVYKATMSLRALRIVSRCSPIDNGRYGAIRMREGGSAPNPSYSPFPLGAFHTDKPIVIQGEIGFDAVGCRGGHCSACCEGLTPSRAPFPPSAPRPDPFPTINVQHPGGPIPNIVLLTSYTVGLRA